MPLLTLTNSIYVKQEPWEQALKKASGALQRRGCTCARAWTWPTSHSLMDTISIHHLLLLLLWLAGTADGCSSWNCSSRFRCSSICSCRPCWLCSRCGLSNFVPFQMIGSLLLGLRAGFSPALQLERSDSCNEHPRCRALSHDPHPIV